MPGVYPLRGAIFVVMLDAWLLFVLVSILCTSCFFLGLYFLAKIYIRKGLNVFVALFAHFGQ